MSCLRGNEGVYTIVCDGLLDGAATFGAKGARAEAGQLVLMGPGETFGVEDALPGTRYLLMAGKPYGEEPRFNGPFVD